MKSLNKGTKKSKSKPIKHSDVKEDKKLVKKMVKSGCIK